MPTRKGKNAIPTRVHVPKNKRYPRKGDTFDEYWEQYIKESERHGDKDEHESETTVR